MDHTFDDPLPFIIIPCKILVCVILIGTGVRWETLWCSMCVFMFRLHIHCTFTHKKFERVTRLIFNGLLKLEMVVIVKLSPEAATDSKVEERKLVHTRV